MTGRDTRVTAERLPGVLHAVATVSADLSLDGLLDRVVRQAGALVGAESGYLDVLDRRSDRRLGTFAAFGVEKLGPVPSSRHLLVALLEECRRPGDRALAPDELPFIGVPVEMGDRVFGNLYLVGKRGGGGFSREDEEVVRSFASAAGVVIDNAHLYEQGERQRLWLEAAADITTTLLGPMSRGKALQLLAERAREVAAADFVALLMPADEKTLRVEAAAGEGVGDVLGETVDPRDSIAGDAVRDGKTIVVPDTDLQPRYRPDKTPSWPDLGSLMILPLRESHRTGALVVGWLKGHQTDRWELDPALPQRFVDQATLVLRVARAQEDEARLAVFEDRDRIARDLHDLIIQRLFAIGLTLDNTTKLIGPGEAADRMSTAIDEIDATIKDIRRTIFALNTGTDSTDLRAQLDTVVTHSANLLGFRPELRLHGPVDTVVTEEVREHLLAVVGEALSNVVRHADASSVVVELDVADDIDLVVIDDGRGLGAGKAGTGFRNMKHRAEMLGGRCHIESEPGNGTRIHWDVPRRSA